MEAATSTSVPLRRSSKPTEPWVNKSYTDLLQKRLACRDPTELKLVQKQIRSLKNTLKNSFYAAKSKAINHASEARDIEKEFRLAKNYHMLKNSTVKTVDNNDLTDFFSDHFKSRHNDLQPELINPEQFSHIPSDIVDLNCDPPTEKEVGDTIKKLKNGKCRGTDGIYSEQLKYNNAKKLLSMITTLMTMIWSTCLIPSIWLTSSITCLHKNKGSRLEAKNYRGLSIMATCSKILMALIISCIRHAYENMLLPTQYGFRANDQQQMQYSFYVHQSKITQKMCSVVSLI